MPSVILVVMATSLLLGVGMTHARSIDQARSGVPQESFVPQDRAEETARSGVPHESFVPEGRAEAAERSGVPQESFVPEGRAEETERASGRLPSSGNTNKGYNF